MTIKLDVDGQQMEFTRPDNEEGEYWFDILEQTAKMLDAMGFHIHKEFHEMFEDHDSVDEAVELWKNKDEKSEYIAKGDYEV